MNMNESFFRLIVCLMNISHVIKRAVNTAPEPDAMICWYGFIGVNVEFVAISEERQKSFTRKPSLHPYDISSFIDNIKSTDRCVRVVFFFNS